MAPRRVSLERRVSPAAGCAPRSAQGPLGAAGGRGRQPSVCARVVRARGTARAHTRTQAPICRASVPFAAAAQHARTPHAHIPRARAVPARTHDRTPLRDWRFPVFAGAGYIVAILTIQVDSICPPRRARPSSPWAQVVTCLFSVLPTWQQLMKSREPMKLRNVCAAHNGLLAVFSLAIFVVCVPSWAMPCTWAEIGVSLTEGGGLEHAGGQGEGSGG
jgi:hypothetical protein